MLLHGQGRCLNYSSEFLADRATLKATVILLPLLGLTWAFGILTIDRNTTVFAWLFTIFNSTQVCLQSYNHICQSLSSKEYYSIYKHKDNVSDTAPETTSKTPAKTILYKKCCRYLLNCQSRNYNTQFWHVQNQSIVSSDKKFWCLVSALQLQVKQCSAILS